MDKQLEKIQALLTKNKEWQDANPTTEGNKNPYPPKIEKEFVKYYNKHYKAVVSYETEENGKVSFEAEVHDIENSLCHAWFDCTTIEECFNTIEYWIGSYREDYIEYEELTLVDDIEVKSVEKK